MNSDQCRMARTTLRWSIDELAAKAQVGRATITRFESGETVRRGTINALRAAVEAAGVIVIEPDEPSLKGGIGVRLVK